MNSADTSVRTTLRIPGNWSDPGELIERMPDGFRLTPEALVLPDDTEFDFTPMAPDDQFREIFESACRRPATDDEMEIIDGYTVNIGLSGPGGSMQAARAMMQAGAAVVRAGGAGVFIDNSALAHGGGNWIEMAEDGGPDAVSFAFASIIHGKTEVWTMGMHVMGLPEVVMRCEDLDEDAETIVDVIRYLCLGDKPIADGHLLADEAGPRFKVVATDSDGLDIGSPMHNPFGRLKLISIKDIGESN